jgi:hypothetical protein
MADGAAAAHAAAQELLARHATHRPTPEATHA